ncbi:hypothetical protein [uncultured Stenotrophomonas sp.]|uniref:hypothetical protein n=1 Tax=uncultured Stenotrophomonas sp. TaxID=165438 RepID=UPI0025EE984F|nr:hypothetical protein [uncultured Stenotrophomonas sp.]
MTGKRTIIVTTVLAILSMVGLIGMLVVEGGWDLFFFLLSILPLLVGVFALWRRRTVR